MEDRTSEILATLRNELSSKSSLFFAPVDSFVERLVYFHVHDILKNNTGRNVVWLCLNSSRDKVLNKFEDFGFDNTEFMDRLWFIDIEVPGKPPQKNTFYCSSPADYTKIASHVANLFEKNPQSMLVIDNMNVIATDTLQVVENFMQFIEKKIREKEGGIVSILLKDILSNDTEMLVKSFFDVVLETTNIGEVHTQVGLKDFDFLYTVEEGSIKLEYSRKKIRHEKLKILIVDDEPDIPELLKLSLISEPYEFLVAYNGEQAIDATLKEQPDLILLDIMMPDMDGYEVVEQLKKSKTASDIPVIMISAKTAVEDKVKGMELGIDDYISKPFDKREVKARIKMVMRRLGWSEED